MRGASVYSFLQGLVTQDVLPLEADFKSRYSFMLNAQGRVLCDAFVYGRDEHPGELLVECDSSAAPAIVKHMKRFLLRSKVGYSSQNVQPSPFLQALHRN